MSRTALRYAGIDNIEWRAMRAEDLPACDEAGIVYTPLVEGRGDWPVGSFGDAQAEVDGVRARVVGLASLIEDKSGPRHDPAVLAKDRADVALLTSLRDSR